MMFTPRGQNLRLSAALLTKRRLAVFVGHLCPGSMKPEGKTMCACGKEESGDCHVGAGQGSITLS